jgi:hypothetical protein
MFSVTLSMLRQTLCRLALPCPSQLPFPSFSDVAEAQSYFASTVLPRPLGPITQNLNSRVAFSINKRTQNMPIRRLRDMWEGSTNTRDVLGAQGARGGLHTVGTVAGFCERGDELSESDDQLSASKLPNAPRSQLWKYQGLMQLLNSWLANKPSK